MLNYLFIKFGDLMEKTKSDICSVEITLAGLQNDKKQLSEMTWLSR